jgi:hypothetical protein
MPKSNAAAAGGGSRAWHSHSDKRGGRGRERSGARAPVAYRANNRSVGVDGEVPCGAGHVRPSGSTMLRAWRSHVSATTTHAQAKRKRAPDRGSRGEFVGTSNRKVINATGLTPNSLDTAAISTGSHENPKFVLSRARYKHDIGCLASEFPKLPIAKRDQATKPRARCITRAETWCPCCGHGAERHR